LNLKLGQRLLLFRREFLSALFAIKHLHVGLSLLFALLNVGPRSSITLVLHIRKHGIDGKLPPSARVLARQNVVRWSELGILQALRIQGKILHYIKDARKLKTIQSDDDFLQLEIKGDLRDIEFELLSISKDRSFQYTRYLAG
jgi:hypothetical protein